MVIIDDFLEVSLWLFATIYNNASGLIYSCDGCGYTSRIIIGIQKNIYVYICMYSYPNILVIIISFWAKYAYINYIMLKASTTLRLIAYA